VQVSDWWMFVSFYQNVLAVPLAIVVLVLLVRAKTPRRRWLYGALIPVVLLPNIQVIVGNVYFDYLCRTQAGEFIYRTVDNVEGILQMRPRDGSKDYFDRMRAGDIPEDPWGHTNAEAQWPWSLIDKYRYIEIPAQSAPVPSMVWNKSLDASMFAHPTEKDAIARFSGYDGHKLGTFRKEFSVSRNSEFGYTWHGYGRILSAVLNIFPGEILVKDLRTDETLAVKRGFLRVRPYRICPPGKDDRLTIEFVQRVLRPASKDRS
jgi:hypothetical protein